MSNWTYNPQDYSDQSFQTIPAGDHRVRVNDVVFKNSSKGNEMFEITFDVSGHGGKLWYYIVLDPNDTKKTNQRIGAFFESFGITNYNMDNYRGWIGKVGAVRVKHEQYNGADQAKVAFCLSRKNQDKLPPAKFNNAAPAADNFAVITDPNDELPF